MKRFAHTAIRRSSGSLVAAALLAAAPAAAEGGPSAASLDAPTAPLPRLGLSLETDPPLPGESTAGWYGLGPASPGNALPASARQGSGNELTLERAVEIALHNNGELRAVRHELEMTRGLQRQAGVLPNPHLELEGVPHHGAAEVAIEYPITRALLAPFRSSAAAAEVGAARLRAKAAAIRTAFEVRSAWYAAQAAQQKLALSNQALDAFVAGRDAARALLVAGNTIALDTATQEAAYEGARIRSAQLELEYHDAREKLHRLLGLHGEATTFTLPAALPAAPAAFPIEDEAAEKGAIAASIELAELQQRMEASSSRASLGSAAGWIPDVSLRAFGEREEGEWAMGGGIELSLPIFDRGQGAVAAERASLAALKARHEALATEIRSAARAARNRLRIAHAELGHYERSVLPTRAKVLEEAVLQYNAMQVGVFQLLQYRRDQLEAQLAHVDALRGYWTAAAAFEAVQSGARVEGGAAPSSAAAAPSSSGGDSH
ncbi:TolC family protein [Vulgatibacter sp.]|uniref:TolC family protein n=1 Tax=Vulgatibacter sp. TaxID=1971226 RepID=UPI0035617BAF